MGQKQSSSKVHKARVEMIRKVFNRLDKNGDGNITLNELQKVLNMPRVDIAKGLERIDADGDSAINFDEFCTLIQKRFLGDFNFLDKNKDGKITLSEMKKAFSRMKASGGAEEYLKSLDKDQNGEVTLDEYIEGCLSVLAFENSK